MQFTMEHTNFNVKNLGESLLFYEKALGLREYRRVEKEDFTIVFLTDQNSKNYLELTWLRDHPQPYDLGEGEFHIAFRTPDFDQAYVLHSEMGCICFENKEMGLYFISDPDGHWIEILPERE